MRNMITDDILSMFGPASDAQLKSDLFARVHELQGMKDELEKVLLLPKKKKQIWMKNYFPMLEDQMEKYMYETSMMLDGAMFDEESKSLAVEYVAGLRDITSVMQGIVREYKHLKG